MHRARLLAAALFVAACSDGVSPAAPFERGGPGLPMFDVASTSDQSGGLNQSGTVIGARFAPNPHRGDAIIATFFWLGPPGIIDSVTDFLTDANSTPVHNTYRLVESASAGGISMATYVALNVQNFPDPSDPPTSVGLAVRANLSTSVQDGGVLLSAWSGVQGVSATQHHSASGSGSTATVAAPGAITLSAGDLAYAVTMSNAVVGRNGSPQGFTNLAVQSDPFIADQADYLASASGGTADPRWTWNFTQQSTWLATVLSLTMTAAPPPPPGNPGNLTATASTTGSSLDPNGYTVTVDQAASQPVATNGGSATFSGLASGTHTVAISGVASNCTVSGGNTQTVTVPSGGTATAPFSVSCTTAASGGGGGITLDTHIGTANQRNLNILIKGFDNGNPRHGDAIVATFFWVSATPTNIIDSVTDVTNDANFTRVGNTYHLVRFVHAGNVSLATYVATNVQNFPDTNQTPHLAVRANLRETVADGGLQLSAWTGVASDFTQAMGDTNSASGSGTTFVADPGAIDIGAGALAYGVSAVSMPPGLLDATPPAEFTIVNVLSDSFFVHEANYLVASGARSVQPQWRWQFDHPMTWLTTVLALNPAAAGPSIGNLTVNTSTTGSSLDPDGYTVTVDGGSPQAIGINASVSYTNLAAGSHTVAISGVATNCTVSGGTSQTVTVPSGGTGTASFTIGCSATTGNLTVNTSTTGSSLDPDGYTVTVDGGSPQAVGINASVSYTNLAAGSHTVAISGVATNCTVSGGTSQAVTVPSGGTGTASFTISCSATTGNLTVSTSTTGSSLDPDGYTVTVDGGSPQAVGINASVSYTNLAAGSHTVAISGVAGNCSVSGGTSRTVSVPSGGTATTTFTVSCTTPPGNLTVSTSTTGSSLDPDGYTVTVDGGSPQAVGINASVSYTSLAAGNHTVAITGVAGNCSVSGGTSRTVSVQSGGTATTTFTVSCTTPPGNLTVSTSTTGSSLDPDGYTVTVDGGSPQAVGINASVSYTSLAAGNHTVAITGVAGNCSVSGGTSRTVSVPSGGTATTTFTVSCTTPPGNLTVSTSTTGSSLDPDGYTVTVDGGSPQAVGINASVSYTNLAAGSHTVAISGVATNCTVSGGTSKTVSVPSGGTATTTFTVSCTTPNRAPVANAGPDETVLLSLLGVTYTLNASFSDPDNGPWSYTINWGDGNTSTGTTASQGTITASHHYANILATRTVTVTVRDASGASGSDSKVLTLIL